MVLLLSSRSALARQNYNERHSSVDHAVFLYEHIISDPFIFFFLFKMVECDLRWKWLLFLVVEVVEEEVVVEDSKLENQ